MLIVSDSGLLGEALQAVLAREPDLAPVLVSTASGLTSAEVTRARPDVVLVDIDAGAGLPAIREVTGGRHPCALFALAEEESPAVLREAPKSQARKFIGKQTTATEMAELIRGCRAEAPSRYVTGPAVETPGLP